MSAPTRLPRDRGEPTLNAVADLLTSASRAGHTVLPPDVVLRTCSQDAVDDALTAGSVVEVEWHGAAALALVDVAESEELLADGLVGLAEENRLAVVVGPDPEARRRTLAMALGSGVPSVAVDDAHLAGVDDVLAAVEDLPEDAVLALSLDNALPLGPVLGAVALDVAASGTCPVLQADPPPARTALARARRDVAAGRWFATSSEDRSVVDVAVGSPDEALVRVVQLVTASIPRAFAATGGDVVVLLAPGTLDPDAVRRALAAVTSADAPGVSATTQVLTLDGPPARTWRTAVVVLPAQPSPSSTRALLYAALGAGTEHVSVVHGSTPTALTAWLTATTDRPRRTRLADLLRT